MSMMSFSSFAQTQQPNTTCAAQQCAASQTTCPVSGAKCDAKGKGQKADPFAGLTLTDTQKAQLQELKAKRANDRATARADKQQARKADIRRNDSTRVADRKQYLEEVKAIVGPDQYVMFLENIVLNSPNGGGHNKAISKADRRGKGFGKAEMSNRHHASNRPFKASKAAKPSKATQATQATQTVQ